MIASGFLVIILLACTKKEELLLTAESFTEKNLSICTDGNCPEITINYVLALGNEKIDEKINSKIQEFIIASLMMGEDSIPTAKNIEEAAIQFIDAYKRDKTEFPDMAGDYFAEINVIELSKTIENYSFEQRQYLYTGGAHGYGSTAFLNIDPNTGKVVTFKEMIKNEFEFTSFVEKKFRAQHDIAIDATINSTGFWFKNDKFNLPETAGITKDSIIFVYNQYDIASYADGPIELRIAKKDVAPFFNFKQ